jgi:MFS family permease
VGAVLLSVASLMISVTILLAGNSLQFVILGLRAEAAGLSLTVIGAMTASYYIGYGLGTFSVPQLVERIGHIRAFAAFCSIISAIVLAHGLWVEAWSWIALRFVAGLCFAGMATVNESWLNAKATPDVRGRVLAIASIAAIGGYAVGPLFASLGAVDGLRLFVIASILMSVALVPVTLTRFSAPAVSGHESGAESYSLLRLYRETPFGAVVCLGTGALQGSFLGLGAVFASQAGLGAGSVSLFMTGALLAGAVMQYPLGWISDRVDRRLVIAVTVLGLAAASVAVAAALAWSGPLLPVMAAAAFIAGIAAMPLYPIVIAHVNDRLPQGSIVPAAAALILAFSIGSAASGPVASTSMSLLGPVGFLGFMALALCSIGAFALVRIALKEAAEPSPQEEGVFAVSTAWAPLDTTLEEDQIAFDFSSPDAEKGGAAAS